MGRGLSDHHLQCKVRLIKRREEVNGAMRIRSEKLREHQYMEGYVRCIGSRLLKASATHWDTPQASVDGRLDRAGSIRLP